MILILTAVPTKKIGQRLAQVLLDKKLAACISIVGQAESHYVWKKKQEKTKEFMCWIKTRKALSRKVEKVIRENHPYEVPEIVSIPVFRVNPPYLKWLRGSTKTK